MTKPLSDKPVRSNQAFSDGKDASSLDGYPNWLQDVSRRYRRSQIKAAVAVNTEMLKFYFGLGRDIVLMEPDQSWGNGFLNRVSADLKTRMPDAGCFSPRNLYYMTAFYRLCGSSLILPQVGAKYAFSREHGTSSAISPQAGAICPQVEDDFENGIVLSERK